MSDPVFDRNFVVGALTVIVGYAIHQLIVTLIYAWRAAKHPPVDPGVESATKQEVRRAASDVVGRLALSKDEDVKRILDAIAENERRTDAKLKAIYHAIRTTRQGTNLPEELDSQAMLETPSDLAKDTFKPELTWKPDESVTVG